MMDISFKNKVAIVTGSSGLIGAKVSESFCNLGAKVIGIDKTAPKNKVHKNFVFFEIDFEKKNRKYLFESILSKFSKIDILVNSKITPDDKIIKKGASNNTEFEYLNMDTLQKSIDVNMHAVIEITKLTIPLIKHSESGRIINMCSTYSLVAPNWQLYSEGNKKI